ncbi:MAG: PQQ-binding-like beta-propeller repeat protein, partial [Planctomycetaceae bacterium]|nr:PQQ-binding-like beta-propeller repeat protein [Planctomycetaceae bacterium]
IAWMAGEPVVDTQAVYVRSSEGLIAMDRLTGKIQWSRLFDRQTDGRRSIDARRAFPDDINRSPPDAANLQNAPVITELHRDAVTTRMTSDALRLFAVCDTGETPAGSFEFEPFHRLQRRGNLLASSMRELMAIEKSTGRRLWSVGGAPLEAQFGNELSRAWFAGPPAVFGNQLFGLVEQDDAHWLVCLRSETGEVVWKLMLAFPDTDIFQDAARQLDASLPLVADGLIWTRTNDGWLIAVDALTRSVIWTRRMTSGPPRAARVRNLRGGQIQLQPPPEFRECWRPEGMHLKSDTLLVTGPEGHQILMLNPLTGSVRRRTSPEAANLILWVDDESIFVSSPQKIQRLQRDNFDVVWATRLTTAGVVPTGPATRFDDHLLVPLSDGSVEVIRYSDGQLTENIPGLRPEFSAGGLKGVGDAIVSYGPNHIGLLSRSSVATPHAPDPIQQAGALVVAGQFAEAQAILAGFTPTSDQAETTRQLLYRIAIALTLKDTANSNEHLQQAARHARSSLENAVVLFLKFETIAEINADQIVELLRAAPEVLHIELPNREEIRSHLTGPVAAHPFRRSDTDAVSDFHPAQPLRRFFLQVLEQHLVAAEPTLSSPWIDALKQISDEDLLSIGRSTPAVRDELLRRANEAINAGNPAEITLHLLLQARQCENQIHLDASAPSAADATAADVEQNFSESFDRFVRCLTANAGSAELPLKPHPAALDLMDVLQFEVLPIREASNAPDPGRLLAEQWSTWKDQSYTAIPVNPVTTGTQLQRNKRRLLPCCGEDRFLSAWDWSAFTDPSVLAARSLLRSTEPIFTIDRGMFDPLSSGEDGTILRCGSVLLIRNSNGLTAVSIIDQQVLWGRRNQDPLEEEPKQITAGRQLFSGFTTDLSAWQDVFNQDLRICGHSDRWVCIQSSTQVEMVDLLTGQNLWSLKIPAKTQLAFATESCVFLSPRTSGSGREPLEAVTCLNRIDGTPRESTISPEQLQQTVLATEDELVVWESPGAETGAASLNWINSTTGAIRHRLPLTNMLNCQFMDVRTLVSMTGTGEFEVIDLLTTEKQVVRFVAESVSDTTPKEKTTPDYLVNSVVVADPLNYYVLPVPRQRTRKAMEMISATGEHNLFAVGREVRAIDRTSGDLRWIYEARENTAVWFEPAAHPVLLLLDSTPRKKKVNAPPLFAFPGLVAHDEYRTTVTALSRNSGTILFEHKVTSRFPGPGLEFIVTPQQILDLQAYGNRVRFIPSTAPATLP